MYVIVIEERHSSVDVELFVDLQAAIDRANAIADGYAWEPGDVEIGLTDHMRAGGWLHYVKWSGESDCAFILECIPVG